VASSLCGILVKGGFEKYIKYISSLICAVIILLPLKSINLSQALKNMEQEEISLSCSMDFNDLRGELTQQKAEEYIISLVFDKFGIKPTGCNINIDWEKEEPVIMEITVLLSTADLENSEQVKDYLEDVLGGEVKVIGG
jgi:hypothetical protein